jgi:hypothetical protein
MATKNGGSRPGAGRKPKADKYIADINKAEKKIRDKLPDIVDAQIGLALGVVVKEKNPITFEDQYYTTIPDRAAGQYLMNRIMGTPTQKQEVSGPEGGPIPVQFLPEPSYEAAVNSITKKAKSLETP